MSQDPRIQAAVDHWGPRYIENGVPPGDFFTVTKTCESWDDWCAAWSEVAARHEAEGDAALAAGHTQSAAYHFVTAAVEYHFGKFLFVHDLHQMRTAHMKAVEAHRKAHPYMSPPVERIEFPYLDGHTLIGHLRKPGWRRAAAGGGDDARTRLGQGGTQFERAVVPGSGDGHLPHRRPRSG